MWLVLEVDESKSQPTTKQVINHLLSSFQSRILTSLSQYNNINILKTAASDNGKECVLGTTLIELWFAGAWQIKGQYFY